MVEDEVVRTSALPADPRPAWVTVAATLGLAVTLAAVANAAGAEVFLQPPPARPALAQSAGVTPLFRLRGMVPGQHYTACVDVAVRSPGRDARVFLAGQDVRGRLASSLRLVVEAGPARGGTTCSTFAAAAVYRGTVADLGADATPPTATGWTPDADATWRFKFTVWAAEGAPSAAFASVGFAWRLSSIAGAAPVPAPRKTTHPTGHRTAHPTGHRTAPPTGHRTAHPTAHPTLHPTPQARPSSAAPAPARPPAGRVPRVVLGHGPAGSDTSFLVKLGRVLRALLRHPAYPSALFAIAVAFVLLQDYVDRRDPKLALAPVRNDDLHFTVRPQDVHR